VKDDGQDGISTIQSYRGAQIFEAVGLNSEFVEKYFTWTPTRMSGCRPGRCSRKRLAHHRRAFPPLSVNTELDAGEPVSVARRRRTALVQSADDSQAANRLPSRQRKIYREYADLINDRAKSLCTLRGLLDFKFHRRNRLPIEGSGIGREHRQAVQTGDELVRLDSPKKRMRTLAIAMNRLGGRSTTGEGGEDPERYTWTNEKGDSKNSAIKQVASGRLVVTEPLSRQRQGASD